LPRDWPWQVTSLGAATSGSQGLNLGPCTSAYPRPPVAQAGPAFAHPGPMHPAPYSLHQPASVSGGGVTPGGWVLDGQLVGANLPAPDFQPRPPYPSPYGYRGYQWLWQPGPPAAAPPPAGPLATYPFQAPSTLAWPGGAATARGACVPAGDDPTATSGFENPAAVASVQLTVGQPPTPKVNVMKRGRAPPVEPEVALTQSQHHEGEDSEDMEPEAVGAGKKRARRPAVPVQVPVPQGGPVAGSSSPSLWATKPQAEPHVASESAPLVGLPANVSLRTYGGAVPLADLHGQGGSSSASGSELEADSETDSEPGGSPAHHPGPPHRDNSQRASATAPLRLGGGELQLGVRIDCGGPLIQCQFCPYTSYFATKVRGSSLTYC
jgi:hypothetical protein